MTTATAVQLDHCDNCRRPFPRTDLEPIPSLTNMIRAEQRYLCPTCLDEWVNVDRYDFEDDCA